MKWFKKHREKKAETQTQQTKNELREFVYLDEVSVTSLLSARTGAIPHEFTDSEGSAYKGDVNGQVEVGIGPLKSRVGSRYEPSRSANSQVVSKATVQALVGRLFELEERDLFLRANLPTSTRPPKKDAGRVLAEELGPAEKYWVIPSSSLTRGQLAEIEVELETDAIFQLSNILVTLKELTDESADLRAQLGPAELLEELIAINNLIEKMMVGLIPLKCRIVDYVAVDTEHGVKIVHRSIFDDLDTDSGYTAQPLYLVGDTQRDLYWKDIRRVLFTQSRFRVLCRLNVTGITTSWNPLKMGNSLRTVAPDLSSKLAAFGRTAVSAFSGTASPENHAHERRTAALDTYGKLVAKELHHSLNAEQESQLSALAHDNRHVFKSASTAPSAFNPIKQYVEQLAGATLSPEVHSRLRAAACHQQELLVDGTLSNPSSYTYSLQQEPSKENLIDAEIIAIYW